MSAFLFLLSVPVPCYDLKVLTRQDNLKTTFPKIKISARKLKINEQNNQKFPYRRSGHNNCAACSIYNVDACRGFFAQ
jgi:hypothetical protein